MEDVKTHTAKDDEVYYVTGYTHPDEYILFSEYVELTDNFIHIPVAYVVMVMVDNVDIAKLYAQLNDIDVVYNYVIAVTEVKTHRLE